MNAALRGDLEHRRGDWDRHSAARMPFDVSQIQVRGVIRAVRADVEAVATAFAVGDRHRAPFSHPVIIAKKRGNNAGSARDTGVAGQALSDATGPSRHLSSEAASGQTRHVPWSRAVERGG